MPEAEEVKNKPAPAQPDAPAEQEGKEGEGDE
jgi:hypothetical protein